MNNEDPSSQSLINRLTEIRNMQNMLSQLRQLRLSNNNHNTLNANNNYSKKLHDYVTSNLMLIISPFILCILFFALMIEINNIKYSIANGDIELIVKSLESKAFFVLYIILFTLIFNVFWLIYLLLYKLITSFEKIPIQSIGLKQTDLLYFNPCFFTVSMIYNNTKELTTFFDIFFLLSYSSIIYIIFIFSKYGTHYFNMKIAAITNLSSKETNALYIKMKIYYSLMMMSSITIMASIGLLLLPWDQLEYSMIFAMRNAYLLLHQIQMCSDIWWIYKQIDSAYCTDERRFINNQYCKLIIETLIQITVLQQLVFFNLKLYNEGVYLVIINGSVILKGILGLISIGVKFYELSAFLTNLELK